MARLVLVLDVREMERHGNWPSRPICLDAGCMHAAAKKGLMTSKRNWKHERPPCRATETYMPKTT